MIKPVLFMIVVVSTTLSTQFLRGSASERWDADFKCTLSVKTDVPISVLSGFPIAYAIDNLIVESGADGIFLLRNVLQETQFFAWPKKKSMPYAGSMVLNASPKPLYVLVRWSPSASLQVAEVSWERDQWAPTEAQLLGRLSSETTKNPSELAAYKKKLPQLLAKEVARYRATQTALKPKSRHDLTEAATKSLLSALSSDLNRLVNDMEKTYIVEDRQTLFWTTGSRVLEPKAKLPDFENALKTLKQCEGSQLSELVREIVVKAREGIEKSRDRRLLEEPAISAMSEALEGKSLGELNRTKLSDLGFYLGDDVYSVPSDIERTQQRMLAKRTLRLKKTQVSEEVILTILRYATEQDAKRSNAFSHQKIRLTDKVIVEGGGELSHQILDLLSLN